MTEWKWLTKAAIEIIHHEQLREHGGLIGIKDENALEAAIARPQHKAAYENPDVYELAAAYLFGIARNHPFSDGNKRTAFLAAYTFLAIHSQRLTANQGEVIEFVLEVAAGQVNESGIAKFLRDHTEALN